MANTTVACTNINLLKESQIPENPSQNELYAVELDGKPATETQLTSKANVDASNFTSTGKSTIAGLGMPSNRYIDLTIGASGATYIAPANGWFTACITGSTTHFCFIRSHDSRIGNSYQYTNGSGSWHCVSIPCKVGDVVTMEYGNCDFQRFAFVYAEGEN